MKYLGNPFFDRAKIANRYMILVNSANTKCCYFQVNNNYSKFIIDRLQQLCHVTFLIYLFVTSTQPTRNIPGIFAVCSLNVTMFRTPRQHLGNILKKKYIKVLDGKVVFVLKEYDLIITIVDHLANFSYHEVLLPEYSRNASRVPVLKIFEGYPHNIVKL